MKIPPIKSVPFIIFLVGTLSASATNLIKLTVTYFGKTDTIPVEKVEPVIFAPGVIPVTTNNNADAAFSPDGRTVYIYQSLNHLSSIVESKLVNGKWTAPATAPFSGTYPDLEPAFSPDGKYLIFASSRPVTPNGTNIDGHYDGKVSAGNGGELWKVKLTKKGWGQPELLPADINSNTSVFSPNVAADGTLYFMRSDSGKEFHLLRSEMKNGIYHKPTPFAFSISGRGDYDPAIAPDESFMIFSSGRSPAPVHTADLFIVFRTASGWTDPLDLRILSPNVHGIEARLSPDHKTLYFSNSRNASGVDVPGDRYIWSVDISGVLRAHGIG